MKIRKHIFVLAFVFLIVPYLLADSSIPRTEKECLAKGGFWGEIGLPGTGKKCDIETTDNGKVCSDSSQCQGICFAPKQAKTGQQINGVCSAHKSEFGCFRTIENKHVTLETCAD